ncbi:hypothetical protein HAD_13574 [Hyphomonas adhaerens MHS-3]|uniref:DUF2066 domain-containing protein n=1 Tax=Hyphomonas adhaerens MHS-3 TaxID=1280949 RepID=A0A069E2B4_9PROT|nr:hypothetical protein [Hyphomonas adhaerens]KCZ83635.1 hypothetical protein HAD_13574 [Hyphomonas adhaerens MHS-3]
MIRMLLASMLAALFAISSAAADTQDVYTIPNLEVDETAPTLIQAREQAMASARLAGARKLIDKITLYEDRIAAGGIPIDGELANRLSAAVDVQEETAGAGRYKGILRVVYNPRMVRAHLDGLKVPYVDTQAPLSLMVPLAASADLEEAWHEAMGPADPGALAPYVTSNLTGYTSYSDWYALSPEAGSLRARRAILAELIGREGTWRVSVSIVTTAGTEVVGTTAPASTLEDAVAATVGLLEENWKRASIIRGGDRTQAKATVRYTSLAEWNTLRGALARSPLVSDFRTTAVARDGAVVTFAYLGDPQRLQNDLLQRGVALGDEPRAGWVLRSAVSAAGVP